MTGKQNCNRLQRDISDDIHLFYEYALIEATKEPHTKRYAALEHREDWANLNPQKDILFVQSPKGQHHKEKRARAQEYFFV